MPLARRGLPTAAAAVAMAATVVAMTGREVAYKDRALAPLGLVDRLRAGLSANGIGPPDLVLGAAVALLGVALAALVASLWALGRGAVPRWPRPRLGTRARVLVHAGVPGGAPASGSEGARAAPERLRDRPGGR